MTRWFEVSVILGLDPRIHKETSKVLIMRWIAGSSPAMTVLRKRIFINYSGHDIVRKKRKEQRESLSAMSTIVRRGASASGEETDEKL